MKAQIANTVARIQDRMKHLTLHDFVVLAWFITFTVPSFMIGYSGLNYSTIVLVMACVCLYVTLYLADRNRQRIHEILSA